MQTTKSTNEFKDRAGRSWSIKVDLGVLRAVKESHGIDLQRVATDPRVLEVIDDHCALAEILGIILAAQLELAGVTSEDFESALDGEALLAATLAIVRAIRDFLPATHAKLVTQLHKTMVVEMRKASERMDRLCSSSKMDELVDAKMKEFDDRLDAFLAEDNV